MAGDGMQQVSFWVHLAVAGRDGESKVRRRCLKVVVTQRLSQPDAFGCGSG